jgi:hypothetical protein
LLASVLALALGASCGSSTPAGSGGAGQACYANGTCNAGLVCLSKLCVAPPDGGGAAGGPSGSAGGGGGVAGTGGAGGTGGSMAGMSGGDAAAGMSGGDAASGASGADAAAGTTGQDAAAGTAGQDAAAGTSGGDAAVDTPHGDGGAESIVNCGLDTSLGPFTFTDGTDLAGESMTGSVDEVDWDGFLGESANTTIADILQVSLFSGHAPFGSTITTMPSIDLSIESDLQTCGACVFLVLNADTTNPRNVEVIQLGPDYVATSGFLDLTQVPAFPATASSRVSGTLSNVVFEHMNVDPATFAATPVGDGCKFTLSSATFDVVVTNQ